MPTVFKTSKLESWRYGKITRCALSVVAVKTLSSLFNATAESLNHSLFLKNLQKLFCNNLTEKKKKLRHIEILPQDLSEKFISDNLSIIGIAQGFFEVYALVQKGLSCPSLNLPLFICI